MKGQRFISSGTVSILAISLLANLAAQAGPPVVSNVRASQQAGTGLVNILYDVSDPEGDHVGITVAVSFDGGATYSAPARTFSGAVYGTNVTPGVNRAIVWDAGADLDPLVWSRVKVKITADDGYWNAPPEMCYVPPGSFWMGDSFGEGGTSERPIHTVYVSGFYMDKYEVSTNLWQEVKAWALANGYTFDNSGSGRGAGHPVHTVSWYDAVKWCNARSQMRGRDPVYYTSGTQTVLYKTGQVSLTNGCVQWTASGYRLPTEAEWEKAARGGASGHRFPWSHTDNITHSLANYYSSTSYPYDTSPTRGYHPTWATGSQPYTSTVGYFAPNGYGLCDMAGNVWEWCWDWYDSGWYSNGGATQNDTRGPTGTATSRVLRGGSWDYYAVNTRCANRVNIAPSHASNYRGFRCVRGL